MMKDLYCLIIVLLSAGFCFGQAGIGTENPQAPLHIAGDLLVQDSFKVTNIGVVNQTDQDFKLVTRMLTSTPLGELTVLDVSVLDNAPINVFTYEFTNLSSDDLTDVNLQFNASNYVVGIADLRQTSGHVTKTNFSATRKSIGQFVARTFISGGTWHLEIGNRILNAPSNVPVSYTVTIIVYGRLFFRQLPPITSSMGSVNGSFSVNGNASSVPNFN